MPHWAVRAGARKKIYFNPREVTAAIVTCGGLCPGLNDVVQGLVRKLEDYGVPEGNVLGIRYASRGASRMWALLQSLSPLMLRVAVSLARHHANLSSLRVSSSCRMDRISCAPRLWPLRDGAGARRYGFRGFYSRRDKPIVLTSAVVEGIQLQGGTILGTSRGGADMKVRFPAATGLVRTRRQPTTLHHAAAPPCATPADRVVHNSGAAHRCPRQSRSADC